MNAGAWSWRRIIAICLLTRRNSRRRSHSSDVRGLRSDSEANTSAAKLADAEIHFTDENELFCGLKLLGFAC